MKHWRRLHLSLSKVILLDKRCTVRRRGFFLHSLTPQNDIRGGDLLLISIKKWFVTDADRNPLQCVSSNQ